VAELAARSYMPCTWVESVTSACSPSSPTAPSRRSTPTTRAPSSPKRRAVSAPMPLAAPVITHTFPSSLPAIRAANGDLPRNRLAIDAAVLALLD
jgi:hypothetical protein